MLIHKIKFWYNKRKYNVLHSNVIFLKKNFANVKNSPQLFVLLDKVDNRELRKLKLLEIRNVRKK
jgi:hypothetical protein